MQPEQLAKGNSEHGHQTALFCWAAQNFAVFPALKWMFAIPNGGERNKIVASNMKAEGVRAGVPDVFLPVSVGTWKGLFIEMKRPVDKTKKQAAGRTSLEQVEWHKYLRSAGYGVFVAFTWEEARDCVVQYLTWEN